MDRHFLAIVRQLQFHIARSRPACSLRLCALCASEKAGNGEWGILRRENKKKVTNIHACSYMYTHLTYTGKNERNKVTRYFAIEFQVAAKKQAPHLKGSTGKKDKEIWGKGISGVSHSAVMAVSLFLTTS